MSLKPKSTSLFLSNEQLEFMNSDHWMLAFVGGVGSGKTFSGCLKMLQEIFKNPKGKYLICACTYTQLMRATVTRFQEICNEFLNLNTYLNKQSKELQLLDTNIHLASMDNPDTLRGPEYNCILVDEADYAKREAIVSLLSRNRKKGVKCKMFFTSSPKGFGNLYDLFVVKASENKKLIRASTFSNKQNLADGFIEEILLPNYDSVMARQEVYGEFISVGAGIVYYALKEDNISELNSYNSNEQIYIGMDFNVDPMTAIVARKTENSIEVIDEFYLRNSNTFEMSEKIKNKYGLKNVTIIPDSTSNQRRTSSMTTDQQILLNDGFRLIHSKNPERQDRFNTVNNLLEKKMLKINKNCRKLINDLRIYEYDTKDKSLGHISDALGYLCYRVSPIRFKLPEVRVY